MSAYGSRSKTSTTVSMFAEFRHPRFFTDESVRHLYPDLELVEPAYDKDKKTILNPEKIGTPKNLKQYEGTERDAYVAFKRVRIGSDDREVRKLLYHEGTVDWVEYDAAVAGGIPVEEAAASHLEGHERTDYGYAKAEYFTRRIVGPYFKLPDPEYETDADGKRILDKDGDPILIKGISNKDVYGDDKVPDGLNPKLHHEASGQIPPISYEWFELWSISLLGDYLTYMDLVHGGRSPVQEETFPHGDVSADDVPDVPQRRGTRGKKPA